MDLLDLLALLLFAGGGWLWYDSLEAREKAVAAARSACASEDLLLLDDTVAIALLSVVVALGCWHAARRLPGDDSPRTSDTRRR